MAIGTPVSIGTTQNKTAGTTTVLTTTAAVPAGALIGIWYSVDGDGANANGEIESVTDSAGNTYVVGEAVSQGTTNAGVAGGIYYAKNATSLASGSTITLNWTGASSPAAKSVSAFYVEGIDTTSPLDVIGTATGTSTTPSVSTSATTTQADVLTIGIVAREGPSGDTFTQDASPAYATPPVIVGTSGGGATSNVTLAGGRFIESATGVKTYNPTLGTSRDWAAVIVTFKGAAAGGIALDANAASVVAASGALTTAIRAATNATATATSTGALTTAIQAAANAASTATSTASLTTAINLATTASSIAAASGDLSTAINLASSAVAAASAAGSLATPGAELAATAQAAASASAALSTAINLATAATATSTATGGLTTQIPVATSAVAQTTGTGALSTAINVAASAVAVASSSGALTAQITFNATALAEARKPMNPASHICRPGSAI